VLAFVFLSCFPRPNYVTVRLRDNTPACTCTCMHARRPVVELHTPYVYPQECGGRADVAWLHLDSGSCQQGELLDRHPGLLIVALDGGSMQVNVSRYSCSTLERAHHQHELVPEDTQHLHLHLDAAHMGVGGDDSWSPSVHKRYLVPPAPYTLSLALLPILSPQRRSRHEELAAATTN
jgi:beta-galactosidase